MAAYRLPGLWLTTSAGWLPRTRIISGTLRSVIEYGLPFTYDMAFWACLVGSVVEAVYRLASALIVTSSVCWFACGAGHRYIELSTSVGFRRWELNVCCINMTQCVCVTDSDTDLLTGSPGFIVCKACEWKDLHSTGIYLQLFVKLNCGRQFRCCHWWMWRVRIVTFNV